MATFPCFFFGLQCIEHPTGASVNVAKFGHHQDLILYPKPKFEDCVDVHLTCATLDRQDRFGIRQVPLRPKTTDP